jgi:hypothetical protein
MIYRAGCEEGCWGTCSPTSGNAVSVRCSTTALVSRPPASRGSLQSLYCNRLHQGMCHPCKAETKEAFECRDLSAERINAEVGDGGTGARTLNKAGRWCMPDTGWRGGLRSPSLSVGAFGWPWAAGGSNPSRAARAFSRC